MKRKLMIILTFFCFIVQGSAWADHDLDIYAFDHIFIFDRFGPAMKTRSICVVELKEDAPLAIGGTVVTPDESNIEEYAHFGTNLIILFVHRIDIIDLKFPAQPKLIKTFPRQHEKITTGVCRIIQQGKKWYVVSDKETLELDMLGSPKDWTIKKMSHDNFNLREKVKKRIFPPFNEVVRDKAPFLVLATEQFQFEVAWESRPSENGKEMYHKKILRKIKKRDRTVQSALVLGEIQETIGGD